MMEIIGNKIRPSGRAILYLQMIQQILGYPEVFTDMKFIQIPTIPLKERVGFRTPSKEVDASFLEEVNSCFQNNDDGIDLSIPSEVLRRKILQLEPWRKHPNELLIIDSYYKSYISLDCVTKFSIRPPELKIIIRQVGQYYRWFKISPKESTYASCKHLLHKDIHFSCWIDGTNHQIKIRKTAFAEIKIFISDLQKQLSSENSFYDIDSHEYPITTMLLLFQDILDTYNVFETNNQEMTDNKREYFHFLKKHLIYKDDEAHLPIPVYSYIKPNMSTRLILHILLSMGEFDTEYDLRLHHS